MNIPIFDNYEYLNVSQHSKMFLPIQIVVLLFYMYLPLEQIVSSVERVYRSPLAGQHFLTTSRTAISTIGSAGLAGSKEHTLILVLSADSETTIFVLNHCIPIKAKSFLP